MLLLSPSFLLLLSEVGLYYKTLQREYEAYRKEHAYILWDSGMYGVCFCLSDYLYTPILYRIQKIDKNMASRNLQIFKLKIH